YRKSWKRFLLGREERQSSDGRPQYPLEAGCAPAPCCGAYLEAHLAWSSLAWNTPSRPNSPTASAWALSLKVSGGGSASLYLPCRTCRCLVLGSTSTSRKPAWVPTWWIDPGSTLPPTRKCRV